MPSPADPAATAEVAAGNTDEGTAVDMVVIVKESTPFPPRGNLPAIDNGLRRGLRIPGFFSDVKK